MQPNNTQKKCRRLTPEQKAADFVTARVGSWGFIIGALVFIAIWAFFNIYEILFHAWDPYPFILLNLVLSCLAAIQAPIILMSQNRSAEIDRQRAKMDYYVNRKTEKEIKILQRDVLSIKAIVSKQPKNKEIEALTVEIKKIQQDLDSSLNSQKTQ